MGIVAPDPNYVVTRQNSGIIIIKKRRRSFIAWLCCLSSRVLPEWSTTSETLIESKLEDEAIFKLPITRNTQNPQQSFRQIKHQSLRRTGRKTTADSLNCSFKIKTHQSTESNSNEANDQVSGLSQVPVSRTPKKDLQASFRRIKSLHTLENLDTKDQKDMQGMARSQSAPKPLDVPSDGISGSSSTADIAEERRLLQMLQQTDAS